MDNNGIIEKRNVNGAAASDEGMQDSFFNILIRHRLTILVTTIIALVMTFLYIIKYTILYVCSLSLCG